MKPDINDVFWLAHLAAPLGDYSMINWSRDALNKDEFGQSEQQVTLFAVQVTTVQQTSAHSFDRQFVSNAN